MYDSADVTPSPRDPHQTPLSTAADQAEASAHAVSPSGDAPLGGVGGTSGTAPEAAAEGEASVTADQVKLALRRVKDPELNLNILDLGLVYEMGVEGNDVTIDMSLTSPGCPSGPEIMGDAERQLQTIPGVGKVAVNLVWSPPWTPDRIEPRVRAYLGF
jgi:metal-sulfur cluster biosynthetic enzyme